jgi:hypothetical protein
MSIPPAKGVDAANLMVRRSRTDRGAVSRLPRAETRIQKSIDFIEQDKLYGIRTIVLRQDYAPAPASILRRFT